MTDFLTTTEAAKVIGVSSSTVGLWCQNHKLNGRKIEGKWVIRRADAEAMAETYHKPTFRPAPTAVRVEAKSGEITPGTYERARAIVIDRWATLMPRETAERYFTELLG